MAVLYITEFNELPITDNAVPQIPMTPPIAEQTVAIGGSTAASSAFNKNTRYVLISADTVCSIAWSSPAGSGSTPTAAATNFRVPANTVLSFGVTAGDKVACITNT